MDTSQSSYPIVENNTSAGFAYIKQLLGFRTGIISIAVFCTVFGYDIACEGSPFSLFFLVRSCLSSLSFVYLDKKPSCILCTIND